MSSPSPLISQEQFISALANGIDINAETPIDQFSFGERMIRWINETDNIYWAAWDQEHDDRVIIDLRNCELMQVWISKNHAAFRRIAPDVEADMAKEFANGAVGIILFCMLDNGEIEEFDLSEIVNVQTGDLQSTPETEEPAGDCPDFDWI